jgi:hypothetical protein
MSLARHDVAGSERNVAPPAERASRIDHSYVACTRGLAVCHDGAPWNRRSILPSMTALTAIESYVASHEIEKSRAATLSSARLTSMTPELWDVILAGGEGIRLRPLTRVICGDERPKQYVRLTGSRSLLQQTLDRAALRIP